MVSKIVLEKEIEQKFKQLFKVDFKPRHIFGNWAYTKAELFVIINKLDELLFKQQIEKDNSRIIKGVGLI
jgi:hypothetical protein